MTSGTGKNTFLIAFIIGAAVLAFFVFEPFLAPLTLGIVFSVILHPVYRRILRFFNGKETLAALTTLILSIVVVLIPIIFVSLQLLREAQSIYSSINSDTPQVLAEWAVQKGPVLDAYVPRASESIAELSTSLGDYAKQSASWLILNIGSAFSSVAGLFLDLFIFLMTLYYLLRDGGRLKSYLMSLSPLGDENNTIIVSRLGAAVNSVVKGKIMIAIIQGVLTGIGLLIFNVPNPVVWGLIAMVVSLVPPIGTAVVLVPAVGYLMITGDTPGAIGLAIWSGGVALSDNLLGPKLMGSGSDIHPLLVLLSVLGGLSFFGPVGLFLGPLVMALLLALISIHTFVTPVKDPSTV